MNNKKILTKFCAISLIPISLLSSNTVMGMKSSTPNAKQSIHENHSISHDDFIKHFNEVLYNEKIPYDDETMKYLYGIDEKRHQEIKEFLIDNNPVNKELAKKVYAELMWLNYDLWNKTHDITTYVPVYDIMALFAHFVSLNQYDYSDCRKQLERKLITESQFDKLLLTIPYRTTYSGFINVFTMHWNRGLDYSQFIKKIYNEETQSIFEQSMNSLLNSLVQLEKTNSNRKRIIAMENINVIIDKFNALIKTNNDPVLTTLSQGMIVFLCQPIQKMIENDLEKSKLLKTPEFKQNPSDSEPKSKSKYVPYYSNSSSDKPEIKYAGSGGYSTVNIYKDTEKNEKVAIKTLYSKLLSPDKKFDIDLIEKLKAIKSPYVMELREIIDLPDNKQGLVMEYVHGHVPLKNALHNTKHFTKSKVLDICMQIANGFNAFEQAGFTHPDMGQHPNNVVIDKNDQVKIIDYDNSKSYIKNENKRSTLKLIATALYVSYKDLYKTFLDKFSLSFDITNDFCGYPVIMDSYYEPLPTFDEIKTVLKDMKSEIEKTK